VIAAKRERTKTPAIYKRGDSYAVVYRDGSGQQRQEPARTYDEARRLRTRRAAAVSDGSYQPRTRERFAGFSAPWVERYRGNGRRRCSESTRREYGPQCQRSAGFGCLAGGRRPRRGARGRRAARRGELDRVPSTSEQDARWLA